MPQLHKRSVSTKSKSKLVAAKVTKAAKVAKIAKKVAKVTKAAPNGISKRLGKVVTKARAAVVKAAGAAKATKRIYFFGGGKADGNKEMKNLLGGKGANLAEMTNIGVPVPPGFTITTDVCTEFYKSGRRLPKGLEDELRVAIGRMEKLAGLKFGDSANPLLVSVRSGARASMPGMMDTILNLGLNDDTAAGLARASGNERFAYDSYRRFVAMYGDVVLGMKPERKEDHDPFEVLLTRKKKTVGAKNDSDLPASALKELVQEFKAEIKARRGVEFPNSPYDQLKGAIMAVFSSWENDRANAYRKLNGIPVEWGTAVNVQAMVFGNKGDDSATGVCFTRNPASGENDFYGEFLINAQGEDVVAGIRTPQKIIELQKTFPKAYKELLDIRKEARKALPRHAGHRVHDRGFEAVHASVPQRQEDGVRQRKNRRRDGRGEADLQERGGPSRGTRSTEPTLTTGVQARGQGPGRQREAHSG